MDNLKNLLDTHSRGAESGTDSDVPDHNDGWEAYAEVGTKPQFFEMENKKGHVQFVT